MDDFQDPDHWVKVFQENFPLPPPSDEGHGPSGWTLQIKQLQKFDLTKCISNISDPSKISFKAYISVFNTPKRMFCGRTWTSPIMNDVTTQFLNLAVYGLLSGVGNIIIVEFSMIVNNDTETSLFFTYINPTSLPDQVFPLYQGTPRMLLSIPDFKISQYFSTAQGQLVIDVLQNNDLLKGAPYMPFCTFFNKPPPGIKLFTPFTLEAVTPINISNIKVQIDSNNDYLSTLEEQMASCIAHEYMVSPEQLNLRVVKKAIHFGMHNTHKFVGDILKPEVNWDFDGRIPFKQYVIDRNFAIIAQLVFTVEINTSFMSNAKVEELPEKVMFEIPIGYAVIIPRPDRIDAEVRVQLGTDSKKCPFGRRVMKMDGLKPPIITFNINYSQVVNPSQELRDLPVEFKLLVMTDGGAMLPLDPATSVLDPTLDKEMNDSLNCNHLRFLFKFFTVRHAFIERFPPNVFNRVRISVEIWPFGVRYSSPCLLQAIEHDCFILKEVDSKSDEKGVIIPLDISLKSTDQVIDYYMQMKSNEIQVKVTDFDSGITMGFFNIPSASLLRQQRTSVQFPSHGSFTSTDGEQLGTFHFACGAFGTLDHSIDKPEFQLRNPIRNDVVVVQPIASVDREFQKMVQSTPEPRFQIAIRYRDGKKKDVILSELQQRFLRTIQLYPIPGIESRFTYTSSYDADEEIQVFVQCADDRLRFVGLNEPFVQTNPFALTRSTDGPFNNGKDVPIGQRLNLLSAPGSKFIARPGEELNLNFIYFSLVEPSESEINVALLDDEGEMLDCFTVKIHGTGAVVHDDVHLYTTQGGTVSHTIHSANTITKAVAANRKVSADPSSFSIRINSSNVKDNISTLLFLYNNEDELVKVVRVNIEIVVEELISVNQKLKLQLDKLANHRICCRTSDYRIAQTLSNQVPAILNASGFVEVKALNQGEVVLSTWDFTRQCLAGIATIKVQSTAMDGSVNLGKIDFTLAVGQSTTKAIPYTNKKNKEKTVRVSSSQPSLVMFDPTHYTVGPGETVMIRVVFLANPHEGSNTIQINIIDSSGKYKGHEYIILNMKYTSK